MGTEPEMETGIDKTWWTLDRIVFFAICAIAAVALTIVAVQAHHARADAKKAATGIALENRARISALEEARVQRLRVINRLALNQCREIELIKKQWRDDTIRRTREQIAEAHEEFARLDETLMLLNLEKTDAIVNRAVKNRNEEIQKLRTNRDDILVRFRPQTCPREVIK